MSPDDSGCQSFRGNLVAFSGVTSARCSQSSQRSDCRRRYGVGQVPCRGFPDSLDLERRTWWKQITSTNPRYDVIGPSYGRASCQGVSLLAGIQERCAYTCRASLISFRRPGSKEPQDCSERQKVLPSAWKGRASRPSAPWPTPPSKYAQRVGQDNDYPAISPRGRLVRPRQSGMSGRGPSCMSQQKRGPPARQP